MFWNCNKLNYIKVHFTDWNEHSGSTWGWVGGELFSQSSGTFVCPTGLPIIYNTNNDGSNVNNYIPSGWNISYIT